MLTHGSSHFIRLRFSHQKNSDGNRIYPCCGKSHQGCETMPAHLYAPPEQRLAEKLRQYAVTPLFNTSSEVADEPLISLETGPSIDGDTEAATGTTTSGPVGGHGSAPKATLAPTGQLPPPPTMTTPSPPNTALLWPAMPDQSTGGASSSANVGRGGTNMLHGIHGVLGSHNAATAQAMPPRSSVGRDVNTDLSHLADVLKLPPVDSAPRAAVALDCEMAGCGDGSSELVYVCAVDVFTGETLLQGFVSPAARVVDWRTRYSGVSAAAVCAARSRGAALRGWKAARAALWRVVDARTVLVGHALWNDLDALRMVHTRVVDTSLLVQAAVRGLVVGTPTTPTMPTRPIPPTVPTTSVAAVGTAATNTVTAVATPGLGGGGDGGDSDAAAAWGGVAEGSEKGVVFSGNVSSGGGGGGGGGGRGIGKRGKAGGGGGGDGDGGGVQLGRGRQWALKDLCQQLLGIAMQTRGRRGHDCHEDALAARELALWCVQHPGQLAAWGAAERLREQVRVEALLAEQARVQEQQRREREAQRERQLQALQQELDTDLL